jgi:hypothetical protein
MTAFLWSPTRARGSHTPRDARIVRVACSALNARSAVTAIACANPLAKE